jgi:glycosyltransferase involved in cell wall biosynthesis
MLYVWDDFHHYFPQNARFSAFAALLTHYLKLWDATSASRVDYLITISHYLAKRVLKRYRRKATVIYPPVDTNFYSPGGCDDNFFLLASALVPRKQLDLAIQAFNRLGLPLKIAGSGWQEEERRLRKMAGPTVEFLGWLDEARMRDHYRRCRALILPGPEDFGIAPVEAQACGKPVIAYGQGAALETIVPLNPRQPSTSHRVTPDVEHPTGVFFYEPTAEALQQAIGFFETHEVRFDRQCIRKHSLLFDKDVFKGRISKFVMEKVARWSGRDRKEGVSL